VYCIIHGIQVKEVVEEQNGGRKLKNQNLVRKGVTKRDQGRGDDPGSLLVRILRASLIRK
jgi:hypothetical protein